MDEELRRRIRLFEQSGQVSPQVCAFVEEQLELAARKWNVRLAEEVVGMMVSHLVMALERERTGKAVEESEGLEDAAEELSEHPVAVEQAKCIVEAARSELDVKLPEREIQFLALHLAAISENQKNYAVEERVSQ
jgi:transcriptional regulatory protein LevR